MARPRRRIREDDDDGDPEDKDSGDMICCDGGGGHNQKKSFQTISKQEGIQLSIRHEVSVGISNPGQ